MESFHSDLLIGFGLQGYSGDGQPSRGDPLCLGRIWSQATKDHLRFPEASSALHWSTIFLLMPKHGKLGKSSGFPGITQGCDTRWLRGFWEGALQKVLDSTFFSLFVSNTLPLPQAVIVFSLCQAPRLPAGRAAAAITTAEWLKGRESLHWPKWFDTKHVYQEAAGSWPAARDLFGQPFLIQERARTIRLRCQWKVEQELLHNVSFNPAHAVFSGQVI